MSEVQKDDLTVFALLFFTQLAACCLTVVHVCPSMRSCCHATHKPDLLGSIANTVNKVLSVNQAKWLHHYKRIARG